MFVGHGSQSADRTGDESDGMNETLCPCDFKQVSLLAIGVALLMSKPQMLY